MTLNEGIFSGPLKKAPKVLFKSFCEAHYEAVREEAFRGGERAVFGQPPNWEDFYPTWSKFAAPPRAVMAVARLKRRVVQSRARARDRA